LGAAAAGRVGAQCLPAVDKLVADQKFDEARAAVQSQLKDNSNDDKALDCMGSIYARQGKSGDAVDWYEKAVKLDDKNAKYHLDLAGALGDEAQKANKLRQPFLARRLKSELERSVALDSNLVDAHDGLMQFYVEAPGFMGGSIDKAKGQADALARLNPLRGHFARAYIARDQKDLATVEREYKAAVAQSPDSLAAWYQLGGHYENQKQWSDAAGVYDRLIATKPAEALPHYLYARVAALSGDNLERGEREVRYWMANAPADAPLVTKSASHLRLGMILEREGKKDVARTEFEAALALNPKNAEAKKHLDAMK
jgi:tetratricopeptide (TPR) repeat protein